MNAVRPLIHQAIKIELMQVRRLTRLAEAAPDECTRQAILRAIQMEVGEAMFWNTVDAAYRTEAAPLPGPGMPCPVAPGVTCPVR